MIPDSVHPFGGLYLLLLATIVAAGIVGARDAIRAPSPIDRRAGATMAAAALIVVCLAVVHALR